MRGERAVRWVQRAATPARVSLVFVAAVAFSVWFFAAGPYEEMRPLGGVPDERFGDGPGDHLRSLGAMGEDGRAAYRTFLLADLAFPLLHALWLTGFLALATRTWRALPDAAVAAPVLALLFDWLENGAFLTLLAQHPEPSIAVAGAAVVFQWLKLAANLAAGLLALAFVAHLIMHPVRRRPVKRSRRDHGRAGGDRDRSRGRR